MSDAIRWDAAEDPPQNIAHLLSLRNELECVDSDCHDTSCNEVQEKSANLGHSVRGEQERGHIGEWDHGNWIQNHQYPHSFVPYSSHFGSEEDHEDWDETLDQICKDVGCPVTEQTHS